MKIFLILLEVENNAEIATLIISDLTASVQRLLDGVPKKTKSFLRSLDFMEPNGFR